MDAAISRGRKGALKIFSRGGRGERRGGAAGAEEENQAIDRDGQARDGLERQDDHDDPDGQAHLGPELE